MIFFHALTVILLSTISPRQQEQQRIHPTLRAVQLSSRFDAVIVDVENLRGKSGFALSHAAVLASLGTWSQMAGLFGKLTLAIDHGDTASSYWIPDSGYSIIFAGPHCKADDTIALELVPFFATELNLSNVMVVTADQELIQRCKRPGLRLEILPPDALIADLKKIIEAFPSHSEIESMDDESDEPSGLVNEYELKLGAELLEVEALLRVRSGMNSKRRKKIRLKGQALWQKLDAVSPRMLERVVHVLKLGRSCESVQELSRPEQNAFLSKWEKEQRSRRRKEKTHDRVVLAENLRLGIEEMYGGTSTAAAVQQDGDAIFSAKAYVFRNLPFPPSNDSLSTNIFEVANTITSALRLVVISDTHGFEDQLTVDGATLPDGDVLLHLGDFSVDRSSDEAAYLKKFDSWLAGQPHPTKIVLRGNHDPRLYSFSQSGATYLTEAKVQQIAGYTFAFVPYLSGGLRRKKCLPKSCDVLVSHVPPRNVLDRCATGKYAGSQTLLKGAQRMTAGPPTLWLCGHIHEARGVVRNTIFCMNKETTVVNAASANSGIASRLEYGPVVVQLGEEGREQGNTKLRNKVEILQMDGQYVFMNQRNAGFFQGKAKESDSRQMLLAVDLGLRTGVSLFDDAGRLLRYENFQFDSAAELQKGATALLDEWEAAVNNSNEYDTNKSWKVSRIAIEGGDPPLAEAWRQAANGQRALLYVKPEEWRADLLTNKEMLSGETSKAASRLIAQQIVSDFGFMVQHDGGDFQTDMAESVLLGLHVSRRLGWGNQRDPAIRRSPNGGVVVPGTA
jgi:Icc-related predicted phosphoesterase